MKSFFSSKIYHNTKRDKHLPIFSILSDEKDFGLESLEPWKKTHTFKNLFIICNGQQVLPFAGEKSSIFYGFKLVGIHIEKYHTYKIERSGSLASDLYDLYKNDSLVIDIVDCRYAWEESMLANTIPVHFIEEVVQIVLGKDIPKIFVVGFSRGASFALQLVENLSKSVDVDYLFSLDPVIASWKGEFKEKVLKLNGKKYPVLKNPNPKTKVFNVCQRGSILSGCAVSGAYTYGGFLHDIEQCDLFSNDHIKLRDKYIPQIFSLIKDLS